MVPTRTALQGLLRPLVVWPSVAAGEVAFDLNVEQVANGSLCRGGGRKDEQATEKQSRTSEGEEERRNKT